jgi:iron complex outermembrane receptor protein
MEKGATACTLATCRKFCRRRISLRAVEAVVCVTVLFSAVRPISAQQKPDDFTSYSIEDLMNVKVTSASKKEQPLSRVAAAMFVITQKDIQRSGATNIPDLLRMVPGLDVAQIDSNTWAISARGFNEEFSDKLMVMVDGRSVYTQTFGGVFWNVLDLPLEDIEQIEVIRGPGGSIWGANAVNGVINIITKKASETKGG